MAKRILLTKKLLLWSAMLVMIAGSSCPASEEEHELKVMITSDLHYTENPKAIDTVVPAVSYSGEFADALTAEVIGQAPDIFIMTGDNTNSGALADMKALAEKLRKIREAGIEVVLTTGNHDFNAASPQTFEEIYFPLLHPQDRDPASLSYTVAVGDVVLLAMDDNAVTLGGQGEFSAETMDWLKQMLEKYREKRIWFLSHHTVLLGKGSESSSSYRIQNEGLAELLEVNKVRLILTGHLHAQNIVQEKDMYEIVSAMPLQGNHLIGFLEEKGDEVTYRAEPLDLEKYGDPGFVKDLREKEAASTLAQREALAGVIALSGYSEAEQEEILDMMFLFLRYYSEGTLADHVQELSGNEVCEKMIDALWDHNYGPWMQSLLENPPVKSTELQFTY